MIKKICRVSSFHLILVASGLIAMSCNKQTFTNPDQTQDFQSTEKFNNKVDLLIVADETTSMVDYQDRLIAQVDNLIGSLNSNSMDYHIGVTGVSFQNSGFGGRLKQGAQGRFLTNTSADLSAELKKLIFSNTLTNIEKGMQSLTNVLSPSYLSTEGAGFIRDDALLAVLFLTNEDDYSTISPAQVIQSIEAVKKPFPSGAKSWIANYIGFLSVDDSCFGVNGSGEVGKQYLQIVDQSAGVKESLCSSNYGAAVSKVRVKISQLLTDYYLKNIPIVDTLKVYVNGVEVSKDSTNGWSYVQDGNFIRFNGSAIPKGSDNIRVDFSPATAG